MVMLMPHNLEVEGSNSVRCCFFGYGLVTRAQAQLENLYFFVVLPYFTGLDRFNQHYKLTLSEVVS